MTFTVAIDGPAGAGKSTVARRVAMRLDLVYIDTGAMYRAIALAALRQGIAPDDAESLAQLARETRIRLSPLDAEGCQTVHLNDAEVTQEIRAPEVSQATSRISAIPAVRATIVEQQRRIGSESRRGVVLEGRDIGTVVFPNAPLKIFLSANPEERARRRYAELKEKGVETDYETVLREQQERDNRDSHREVAPLIPAPDAVQIPTDALSVEEVVERILALCCERGYAQEGALQP
jgi:cytidylate kinase